MLTYASHSPEAEQQTELYNAIGEYFRKRFRKLPFRDAVDIVSHLSQDSENKLSVLDQNFWVWETLEEAIRP